VAEPVASSASGNQRGERGQGLSFQNQSMIGLMEGISLGNSGLNVVIVARTPVIVSDVLSLRRMIWAGSGMAPFRPNPRMR
jgi:hypothetical protein